MKITNSTDFAPFAPNFKVAEFWKGTDFEISESLIKACQLIRTYFGLAMTITSTIRPLDTFGYHKTGEAVDLVASDPGQRTKIISEWNAEVKNYLKNTSPLIKSLRRAGITGFGIENTCVHLDIRPETVCNRGDEFGKFLAFEFEYYMAGGKMVITKNQAL